MSNIAYTEKELETLYNNKQLPNDDFFQIKNEDGENIGWTSHEELVLKLKWEENQIK